MKETTDTKWKSLWNENTLTNDVTNEGLIFKYINSSHNSLSLYIKKKEQSNFKMGIRPEQTFFQRRQTDSQQAYEKILNITNYQRKVVKTTMRYCFTPIRMAIIEELTDNKCWIRCREKGTLLRCWQKCKLVQPL